MYTEGLELDALTHLDPLDNDSEEAGNNAGPYWEQDTVRCVPTTDTRRALRCRRYRRARVCPLQERPPVRSTCREDAVAVRLRCVYGAF